MRVTWYIIDEEINDSILYRRNDLFQTNPGGLFPLLLVIKTEIFTDSVSVKELFINAEFASTGCKCLEWRSSSWLDKIG